MRTEKQLQNVRSLQIYTKNHLFKKLGKIRPVIIWGSKKEQERQENLTKES